jgi:sporulation integral membrane protein YtvI
MKDSRLGTNSLLAIMFLILLKIGFINSLVQNNLLWLVIFMPVIGRIGVMIMTYKTVTPRAKGMGNLFIGKCTMGMLITGIVYSSILIILFGKFIFLQPIATIIKVLSSIIFIIVFAIIIGAVTWAIVSLISESTNLLQMLNLYINKAYTQVQESISKLSIEKLNVSKDIINMFQNTSQEILVKLSNWMTQFLTNLIEIITSIPAMAIYVVITIMSLYFMCTDKIYMLDLLEHHMPQKWVRKLGKHIREITFSLGGYLKAEATLILISFIISVIGLYLLKVIGMDIKYPLLIALAIGFVDALPILGSGTVMVPWAIISALNGDLKLGISIIVLWIIMSVVRQFLEPKIVSGKIGIHPIFTLIAMYTGFKLIGVMGMLVGPIVLIILKSIFAKEIDEGFYNRFF